MLDKVMIASTYLPPASGGAEQVVWAVAQQMAKTCEVQILTTGKKPIFRQGNLTVNYVHWHRLMTIYYATIGKQKINGIMNEFFPQVVHSHISLPWGFVLNKANAKKVITCHGSDVFPVKGFPKKYFLMTALSNADIVTAPSQWLCKHVEENYRIPCTCIPNGVDTDVFKPLTNNTKRPKLENVVLYVGRLLERKGVLDLIEAAKLLPEYEFWLIGNPKLNGSVKIPKLDNIKMLGFVDNVVEYYNQATICVFPSHWENFPMVGLEAMACGKAVIATKLGFSEYIEDKKDGLLVESQNIKSLTNCISRLVNDGSLRKRLEENAQKKALKYSWAAITESYLKLYRELL